MLLRIGVRLFRWLQLSVERAKVPSLQVVLLVLRRYVERKKHLLYK